MAKGVARLFAECADELDPIKAMDKRLREGFGNLLNTSNRLVNNYSETSASAGRKRLKEQAATYETKIETVRNSTKMQVSNAKAECEANHQKKLEEQVKILIAGDNFVLEEMKARVETLTETINKQMAANLVLESRLASTKGEGETLRSRWKAALAELEPLQAKFEELKMERDAAIAEATQQKERAHAETEVRREKERELDDLQKWASQTVQELKQEIELVTTEAEAAAKAAAVAQE